uniref:Putative SAM-dependent methyltransferases n=1 Tax=Magnetococcus massalia (strain MO-1) TaxID=451514 RepID=A0A1S7LIL3_MAGMO|nr:Putative SAM-dependent methyltransferases [Candidatus Magnetococcus massalia]
MTQQPPDNSSQRTLAHYELTAESFWQATHDHDVSQNITAFLDALPADSGLQLLDFGCGPGRDLLTFKQAGHLATGLDGCASFCQMARERTGCRVWQQDFLQLELPTEQFHGIYANASLFHVPGKWLPKVLGQLRAALKPKGILFSSNPRGDREEWRGERYGNFMELEPYSKQLQQAGFKLLHHYYRPAGKPREEQPWLAVVSCVK